MLQRKNQGADYVMTSGHLPMAVDADKAPKQKSHYEY